MLLWASYAAATVRHDSPKSIFGPGTEIFPTTSNSTILTLSDGSTFTLESRIRCLSTAPADCLSANAIFAYFYVITVGRQRIAQPFSLRVTAPFDTYDSASLTWGIVDVVDLDSGEGTVIANCGSAACIDSVLAQSSSYQAGTFTLNLDPTTLASGAFQPGDQIFLFATSFSPPRCAFDFTSGLSCDSTSLTGTLSLSASGGSVTPATAPGLVPVLPTPGRRLLAPSETTYFSPQTRFSGDTVDVQANQLQSNTLLPGFVVSSVDSLGCAGCSSGGNNVSFGYLYNLQIPSTANNSSLPGTVTLTLSAPFNQHNFEFLDFGVLGQDVAGNSSLVLNCNPSSGPTTYDTCIDSLVTIAPLQPTALTFTVNTANLSPGDNLLLFASSNNKPNSCNGATNSCVASTPISLQGDLTTTLSIATGSPNTVTGPSESLPVPSISSLSPASALQSSAAFTLTVNGAPLLPFTDFVTGAQVYWNGSSRPTTFISPTQLTAQITAGDLAASGIVPVTVVNPPNPSTTTTPNGGPSSPANFTVIAPNPLPSMTSINPTSANAGGPAFTLTVNGTGFVPTSQVSFNGNAEATSFISSTQVTAAIPASDIASPAAANITVANPAPGGGTSAPQTFTVSNQPWVVSLSPSSGSGLTQAFSVVIADPSGISDLKTMHLLFSASPTNQASVCHVYYAVAVNHLYLYNDAGNTLSAAVTPGVATAVSNSQCTLTGSGSSFSVSGKNLAANVALTFASTFSGQKNVFVYSSGNNGLNTGWVQKGLWTPAVPQPPTVVSLSPASGSGTTQTFSTQISDPNGLSDLKSTHILFGTSGANQTSTCHLYYGVAANQLFLYDDAGVNLSPSVVPGSAVVVSNAQCSLNGAGSSISRSGNNLTLNVALTFTSSYTGQRNVYVYAGANNGTNTGWVQKGVWTATVAQPPVIVSLAPNAGSGATQTFSVVLSDAIGTSDLKTAHLLFNTTSANQASACWVYFAVAANKLYLYNDAGTALLPAVTPGSSGTVSNSQCTLAGIGSSVGASGSNMTLNVSLTFASGFTAQKNIYIYSSGNTGLSTGWVQKGTWTPNTPQPPAVVSLTPNAGAGGTQTFSVVLSDPNGLSDLKTTHLLFGTSSTNQSSACHIYYAAAANQLYVYNDAGTTLSAPLTPGSVAAAANSQCTISGAGSSISKSGNNLTLNVALTFAGLFTGLKNEYVYASGNSGLNTGWVQKGSWTPWVSTPLSIVSASPMPSSFFGMAITTSAPNHYPSVPFGALRLWDSGVAWSELQPSPGVYNFAPLDAWLAQAYANNKTVLYTFGRVPTWAGGGLSNNSPPSDIGSGNAQYAAFVTALVQHSTASPTAKISYYELWDEPDSSLYWTGTHAQMVTMAQTAYNIIRSLDPSAIVVGPGIAGSNDPPTLAWMSGYWSAGGAPYQDIVAYHAYTGNPISYPSYVPGLISAIQALQLRFNISSKPIWFTEGSWGDNKTLGPVGLTDDQKVAYMAQQYLLLWGYGVAHYYWYEWDNLKGFGTLWSSSSGVSPAGTAYGVLYNCLVGSSQTSPLTQAADGTWSASLTLADGTSAQFIWNPLANESINTAFSNYLTLDGVSHPISNSSVSIGNTPILLFTPPASTAAAQ